MGSESISIAYGFLKSSDYGRASCRRHGNWRRKPASSPPESGTTVEAIINDATVGTLTVDSATRDGEGLVKITALDAVRQLKVSTLTEDYTRAGPETVVRDAASEAGVPVAELSATTGSRGRFQFSETKCSKVIEQIARLSDAIWYITADNELVVTDVPDPDTHTLDALKPETSAGLAAPPYTKVIVYAASSASAGDTARTGGQSAERLLASSPIRASVGDDDGATYTARVANARTQQQAENYARALLREFKRQRAEGAIVALGDAAIRPLDAVALETVEGAPTYVVSEVRHQVSNQDGFLSRITPSAVV
jgi:hypothetical protein